MLTRIVVLKIEATGRAWDAPLKVTVREQYLRPTKGWAWNSQRRVLTRKREWLTTLKGRPFWYGQLERVRPSRPPPIPIDFAFRMLAAGWR